METREQNSTYLLYGILVFSGLILLGPYIGIRLFSPTVTEERASSPASLSTAPRATSQQGRSKPAERNDYSSIEDLLAK